MALGDSGRGKSRRSGLSDGLVSDGGGNGGEVQPPLLLVAEPKLTNGVFKSSLVEHDVFRLTIPPDRHSISFTDWPAAVGEHPMPA